MILALALFFHFVLFLAAIALVALLVDWFRFIARRIGIDAIELIARYGAARLDTEQRRIQQDGARLAIQQQRKLLRGTPTAWDIEILK